MNAQNNHMEDALKSYQADYQTGDWEAMEVLLDTDAGDSGIIPPIIEPSKKQINYLKIFSIMTITSLLTTAILFASLTYTSSAIETEKSAKNVLTEKNHFVEPSSTSVDEVANTSTSTKTNRTFLKHSSMKQVVYSTTPVVLESITASEMVTAPQPIELPDSSLSADSSRFHKVVTRRYWVEDRYEYQYIDPSKDIEDFWIGMHYAQQNPLNANLWDSIGRRTKTHGFSLQFMSGNLLPGENWAIYGGLDWGMQFYGRSKKDSVIINSVNEDRGFSFMRSHSNDILMRWHFEYAAQPMIPYFNVGFGTRIFSTGQTINGLASAKDYESSSDHSLKSAATGLFNVSAGAKFRISPRTHLDIRHEWNFTGEADVVDYGASRFNGMQYNLENRKMDLSSSQWKVGFIFDLSYDERKKVLAEEAHYEEETQELYITDKEAQIIIPCTDPPRRKRVYNPEEDDEKSHPLDGILDGGGYPSSPSIGGGNGGSVGGGKSSFPGVKTPTIKN